MRVDVIDTSKKKVGEIELDDRVFGAEANPDLFWEMVKAQRASRRAGTQATKRKSEVRGGGKKPFKQKGTGQAREGSIRAPHMVGGGVALGPQPRSYAYHVPKKAARKALGSALSLRAKEQKLLVVRGWEPKEPKTKAAEKVLRTLGAERALIVDGAANATLWKSLRNLPAAKFLPIEGLNVYDVLRYDHLVMSEAAVKHVEARLSERK